MSGGNDVLELPQWTDGKGGGGRSARVGTLCHAEYLGNHLGLLVLPFPPAVSVLNSACSVIN